MAEDITDQVVKELASKFSLDQTRFVEKFVALFYDQVVQKIAQENIQDEKTDQDAEPFEVIAENVEYLTLFSDELMGQLKAISTALADTAVKDSKNDNNVVEDKETELVIGKFSPAALTQLEKLIGTDQTKKITTDSKTPKLGGGLGGLLGGIGTAVVGFIGSLAGIAAVIASAGLVFQGLVDSGPFKGLQKILGTNALALSLQLLESSAKTLISGLKTIVDVPLKFAKSVVSKISSLFGKKIAETAGAEVAEKGATSLTKGLAKGVLSKMAGTVGKFVLGAVKKLPLLGGLISAGYAVSRFMKGDVVGGVIDTLSALANLLYLVAPPVAFGVTMGLDVLNAVLDAKAGGSSAEASQKKMGILGDWISGMWKWITDTFQSWPFIGKLISIGNAVGAGDWADALFHMATFVPGSEWILSVLGGNKAIDTLKQNTENAVDVVSGLWNWIVSNVSSWPVISSLKIIADSALTGDWNNVLLEIAKMVPGMDVITSALRTVSEVAVTAAPAAIDFFGGLKDHVERMIVENPILGPAYAAVKKGDFVGAIKALGSWIPGLGAISSIFSKIKDNIFGDSREEDFNEEQTKRTSEKKKAKEAKIVQENAKIAEATAESNITIPKDIDKQIAINIAQDTDNPALKFLCEQVAVVNSELSRITKGVFELAKVMASSEGQEARLPVGFMQNGARQDPTANTVLRAARGNSSITDVRLDIARNIG